MNDEFNQSVGKRYSFAAKHIATSEARKSDHPMPPPTHQQLTELVTQTCQHPRGSSERRLGLSKLIRAIIASGKLWRENTPYYEEALQQTWLYLCRNLCEADTGEQYNSTRSSVITWLDRYLKRRLQDFCLEQQQQKHQYATLGVADTIQTTNPIDNLAAPPDIPRMLEETRHWIETDPDRELRRIHIRDRPDLTCQVLMLRRLPPKTDWKILAAELNCSYSTLANFYQRQCLPRLRNFGKSQGYL